jgi:hypothetical protein
MTKNDLVSTRDVVQGDVNFIMSTWLKGLLYGGDEYFRKIPKDIYFANHHKILEQIILRPSTKIKVCCLKDSPDVILSYCVYAETENKSVVIWTFTKKDWRGIGLSKSLWPPNIFAITNLTRVGEAILKKYPRVSFNPYL